MGEPVTSAESIEPYSLIETGCNMSGTVKQAPKRIKFCQWRKCHDWFMPSGGTQVYCSKKCNIDKSKEDSMVFKRCPECGESFIAAREFCSVGCACIKEWRTDAEIQKKMPKIIKMYRDQFGQKAIAKEFGLSTSTVGRWLKIAGVKEDRCPHEARRNSPVQRGDLKRSKSEIAIRNELKRRQDNKKPQKSIAQLPLFQLAGNTPSEAVMQLRKANAKKARDGVNANAVSMGYKSEYHRRYKTEPEFRLKEIWKRRLRKIMDGGRAGRRIGAALGCSSIELRSWMETLFDDWMTWGNMGNGGDRGWHVDHVVPCSWFDQSDDDHVAICWHFTNLRPLCRVENSLRKASGHGCDDHFDRIVGLSCLNKDSTNSLNKLIAFYNENRGTKS
jgi:hypothetical protein